MFNFDIDTPTANVDLLPRSPSNLTDQNHITPEPDNHAKLTDLLNDSKSFTISEHPAKFDPKLALDFGPVNSNGHLLSSIQHQSKLRPRS